MSTSQYNFVLPYILRQQGSNYFLDAPPPSGCQQWRRDLYQAVDPITSELDQSARDERSSSERKDNGCGERSVLWLTWCCPESYNSAWQATAGYTAHISGWCCQRQGAENIHRCGRIYSEATPTDQRAFQRSRKVWKTLSFPACKTSFTTLRFKMWIRRTMTQKRLPHTALQTCPQWDTGQKICSRVHVVMSVQHPHKINKSQLLTFQTLGPWNMKMTHWLSK